MIWVRFKYNIVVLGKILVVGKYAVMLTVNNSKFRTIHPQYVS